MCYEVFTGIFKTKDFNRNQKPSGGHFVIHYSSALKEKTFKDIAKNLDENFDSVCDFHSLSEEEKKNLITNIYIYDEQGLFLLCSFCNKEYFWALGQGGNKEINLANPQKVPYEEQIQCALHEFVHVITFLDNDYDNRRFGWVNEGIAMYLAGQKPTEQDLKDAFNSPLNEENLNIIFGDDYDKFCKISGHTYSYLIIDFIMNNAEFGKEKLQKILRELQISPFEILGVSKEEFQQGWIKFFETKYGANVS